MRAYISIDEALGDLKSRGFSIDFTIKRDSIYIEPMNLGFESGEFHIIEYYRFRGISDVENYSMVYAIETNSGFKGVLIGELKAF